MLGQLIVNGIAMGSLYALIALALVMIYKTSEVINFAQGEISMAATFVAYVLIADKGFGFPSPSPRRSRSRSRSARRSSF
ncbi:MAG: hypothetical protein M5R36_13210 [Deltaproteobacteria bacterium]|nr:hypothetical protein [Deltaproteobacteria bacterium]